MKRDELPEGWELKTLGKACQVNVRDRRLRELPDNLSMSFVPMAVVAAEQGAIATPQIRPLKDVCKGFTPFVDGDVIFAKITPCMDNRKAAIARDLNNSLGFGSAEFHVLRPTDVVTLEWIFYFVRRQEFRNEAKENFSGTAGQLRVPCAFVRGAEIPVLPLDEQRRIIATLRVEALFA